MKKILALVLALVMIASLAACAKAGNDKKPESTPTVTDAPKPTGTDPAAPPADDQATVMSYAEYIAAPLDSDVVIEAYVQAHQSWWDNKITVYAQDADGAYFLYEMACTEEDAAKLVPGTKIRVTGVKAEWAGEVEITDCKFEIIQGDTWVAEPFDATLDLLEGSLLQYQNELALFKGMKVEKIEYKNGEPGDDIYLTVSKMGQTFDFCVEVYLTGTDSDVYKTVGTLKVGDCVDIQGFIYWYNGPNPHITAITNLSTKGEGVMTYAEYAAAPLDSDVVIEAYVQDHQSWWDNKITVYAQDPDGAYFLYEMACAEEDAAKLVPGTKIRVTGVKAEWAGEVEITDCKFEIIQGDTWVAEPFDATLDLLEGSLLQYQNELALFKGMKVEKIEYKNGEPGDDIYLTVSNNGVTWDFCVEVYLTGTDSDVYKKVATLKAGDVVDIVAFVYWYNGPNPHVIGIG